METLEEALEKIKGLTANVESLTKTLDAESGKREYATGESKKNADKYKALRDEMDAAAKKAADDTDDYQKKYEFEKSEREKAETRAEKAEGEKGGLAKQLVNGKVDLALTEAGIGTKQMGVARSLVDYNDLKRQEDGAICSESLKALVENAKAKATDADLDIFKVDVAGTKNAPIGEPKGAEKKPSFQEEGLKKLEAMGAL